MLKKIILSYKYWTLDKNKMLINLSYYETVERVKELIDDGADINYQDPETKNTALIIASKWGYFEVVEYLLKSGADHNIQNYHGSTALILASWYGNYRIIELLIKSGVNLEIQNQYGYTALTTASIYGNLKSIRSLLKAGANTNKILFEDILFRRPCLAKIINKISICVLISNNLLNDDLLRHIWNFL